MLEESAAYVHGGKTTHTSNRYLQNQEKEAHVASSIVTTKDNSLHKVNSSSSHQLQNDGMAIIFWALLVEKVAKRTRIPLNCASYLGVELFSLSIKYLSKSTILACLSCY
jgi:hypothetical protein